MYKEDLSIKESHIENYLKINWKIINREANEYDLFYLCPLVERLLVEILDLKGFNVEQLKQGMIRTITPIIEECDKRSLLLEKDISLLKEIYKEDGIRNKLFHNNYDNEEIKKKTVEDFKVLANNLCNLYDEIYEKQTNEEIGIIENILI